MKEMLKSKKAKALFLGIIGLVLTTVLGVDEASSGKLVALVGTYMISQGVADAGKHIK